MATFLEKNGVFFEKKNTIQVDREDVISIFDHRIRVPITKRSNISEETWQNAISDNRALIVVHRNQNNPCSGAKFLDATNDIAHIIGMMYNILLREYNRNLPVAIQYDSFPRLVSRSNVDSFTRNRLERRIAVYGIEMRHINLLIIFKNARNAQVHRECWNFNLNVSRLNQQQDALEMLHTIRQSRAFGEAFELCTFCVYR
ncbi:unnamed protein product [Rhizophagus irregularis]|uniref:Uncharacterized protein n=1 Tax=Rhizophagus irregularis TaxID=588596 RepID=A0A916E461_9GLOM|nr:unnamed protein product [Rhizophagus irregularis]